MPNWIIVEDSLKGRERAVERERERIIKLLERTVDVYLADKLLFEAAIISNAIANIKGETVE
jgi:hypothetical protein